MTARTAGRSSPYLLIAPMVALIGVFLVYPIASVFYYALYQYNPTKPWTNAFVGLGNFRRMLTEDPLFWSSLWFTLRWVAVEVSLQLLLGLGLALVVNEAFRGRGFARAIVFSPWAVSGVLTTAIWILIYNPATGLGRYLGLGDFAVLADSGTVFGAAVAAELWRGIPFFAIMLLADMQSIPKDLYDAADVDGAGRRQRFWNITLPHLRDAIVIATLLRVIWEFNNVDLLYTLTGGGPAQLTTTLPLYVAQKAIHDYDFGYGSAMTVAGFVLLLLFSLLYLRLTRYDREKI